MLTKMILNNFMSHVSTEVDLTSVQTVTGANDSGKSAFIFALYWVTTQAGNDSVINNKAKECSVRVESDKGCVTKTREKGGKTTYEVNGQFWYKAEVPDEVFSVLEIHKNAVTDSYINFYFQHDGLFLLSENAGSAMAIMGKLIDADILISANKRIQKNARILKVEEAAAKEEAKALSNSLQLLGGLDSCKEDHKRTNLRFKAYKEGFGKLKTLQDSLSSLLSSSSVLRHSQDVCTVLDSLPRVPNSSVEEITKLQKNIHVLREVILLKDFAAAKVNSLENLPSTVFVTGASAALDKVKKLYDCLVKAEKQKLQSVAVVNTLCKLENCSKSVAKLSYDLSLVKKLNASCRDLKNSSSILKVCKAKIELLDEVLTNNVALHNASSASYTALSGIRNTCITIKDVAYSLEKAKESLKDVVVKLGEAEKEKKGFELALGGVCPLCHHILEVTE